MFFPCYSVPEVFAKVKISFWKWRKNTKMTELISFFFLLFQNTESNNQSIQSNTPSLCSRTTLKDNNKLEITSYRVSWHLKLGCLFAILFASLTSLSSSDQTFRVTSLLTILVLSKNMSSIWSVFTRVAGSYVNFIGTKESLYIRKD